MQDLFIVHETQLLTCACELAGSSGELKKSLGRTVQAKNNRNTYGFMEGWPWLKLDRRSAYPQAVPRFCVLASRMDLGKLWRISCPTMKHPSWRAVAGKAMYANFPSQCLGHELHQHMKRNLIALCKKVGHGHFLCHTSLLRRFLLRNTFLTYLYNKTMYSCKFLYIRNLLV